MKDRIKATCFLMAMLTVLNMSGCAKKVKCSETANHSHLYDCSIDDVTVKRYFTSEYEEKKEGDLVFDRTKYYSLSTKRLNLIIDNDLANMNDNFEYLAYLEENGYKNSKNKWICYCIDIEDNILCDEFDDIETAVSSGYCYFKCTGNIDDIISLEKGKTLTKSIR